MKRWRVFIADDRVHEIGWLVHLLEDDLGCDVTLKTNEKDTQDHFEVLLEKNPDKSNLYSLAIIDIMIPVASLEDLVVLDEEFLHSSRDTGIRLCEFLRKDLQISEEQMPIIAISARGDEELVRSLKTLNVSLFGRHQLEIRDYLAELLKSP